MKLFVLIVSPSVSFLFEITILSVAGVGLLCKGRKLEK